MSTRLTVARPRTIAALTTTALAASALVAVGTAANAAPPPAADFSVSSAAGYVDALAAASADATQDHTITFTADFALSEGDDVTYSGTTDLTVDGGGHTVSGPGAAAVGDTPTDDAFLTARAQDGLLDADIIVTDVTVRDFPGYSTLLAQTSGTLTVTDATFIDNGAPLDIENLPQTPYNAAVAAAGPIVVERSDFYGNNGLFGGAIGNLLEISEQTGGDPVTVSDSNFEDNGGYIGGAIIATGKLTLTNSTLTSNTAIMGGAVAGLSDLDVRGSNFRDNSAGFGQEGAPGGGAIIAGANMSINTSTFTANDASAGGAIMYTNIGWGASDAAPALTVSASTFDQNSAFDGAGAILVAESYGVKTTLTNNTFSSNSVTNAGSADDFLSAGALLILGDDEDGSAVALLHNTFSGNTGGDVADLSIPNAGADSVSLIANVFDSADDSCTLVPGSTIASDNFDALGTCTDDWSGDGNVGDGLVSMLGALTDNGGATQTMLPGASSPLLDAVQGECAVNVDQRGVERPQGAACDIGSVEVEPTPECTDVTFQIETDKGVIDAVARCAISVSNISWTAAADVTSTPPVGIVLPLGIASFDIAVANAGDSVTVDLALPLAVTQFWKITGGDWAQVDGAIIDSAGTGITYTLTDGGEGDEDGTANAVIVDPIAPAVGAAFTG